ncbi:hypothetical protein TcG_03122 [Trypanosoma cruzi]|uniref:RING-type domain-containing protein n=1 Tax=Trypanosoma cruzi TaxID=5693 RepID=A0A2V2VTU4_TRYCR|nr:hypothetical protein C4B63_8g53 [Trypanosoma cruzi]RNF21102.1 hypothetical protein TcG_03122 [Trypanosoma cruzi]
MFLFDAMRHAECSICLQALLPGTGSSASPSNGVSPEKKLPSPPRVSPAPQLGEVSSGEEEFRITFAPGVSRQGTTDDFMTFINALDMYHRAAKKHGSRHRTSREVGCGVTPCGADHGIVVLPCGHLLHFLCAIQLHEYSNHPTCPICREAIKSPEDCVLFLPLSRPTVFQRGMAVDGEVNACDISRTDEDGGENVQFTGEGSVAPADVYRRHIQHELDELKRRRRNLRSREHFLTNSRDQLEEQCISLEQSASDARRRYDVLTRQGTVGLDRLKELRDVALKTHTSMEQLTLELARLLRQQRDLDQQLEKYSQRLKRGRLSGQGIHSGSEGGGITRDDDNDDDLPFSLQKRRLKAPMAGVPFSYYVSRDKK